LKIRTFHGRHFTNIASTRLALKVRMIDDVLATIFFILLVQLKT